MEAEKQFIYSKYSYLKLKESGNNPIIDFELNDLCVLLKEYHQQQLSKASPLTQEEPPITKEQAAKMLPSEEGILQEGQKRCRTTTGILIGNNLKWFNKGAKWMRTKSIEALSSRVGGVESDAVEFAKWIPINGWIKSRYEEHKAWFMIENTRRRPLFKSTEELYALYKSETNKQ